MGASRGLSGVRAVVTGLVASLTISLHGATLTGSAVAQAVLAPDVRDAESGGENPGSSAAVPGEIPAKCGKCHSPCEEWTHHGSLAPLRMPGRELPLDAEGRIGCLTCHDPHADRVEGAAGARLRMSNLRRELCLACHGHDDGAGPGIEIVSPLERAIVQEDHLALIGRASRLAGALLTVRINGAEFYLRVKEGHFFTWLALRDGVNRIEVAQDDRLLWQGEVFRGGNALDSYGRTSSGHGTGCREECLGCHVTKGEMSAETKGAAPALCYGCHDRIDGKRYMHGPLAVGDCLACHDPHGGIGSAHLRQEPGLLCRGCHPAREDAPKALCDASGKGCVTCHDPHQSDARYLLKGPQYTMRDLPAERP